jgi:hypothetical protein
LGSGGSVGLASWVSSRLRIVAATSSDAAACTTGTSSEGTTNRVRRIAIIRTSTRCSYSSRATSSSVRAGQRASTDR